ncbi:hypothetical protein F5B22DRAFT_156678 [Xylaria bambusicola]|uniref:uncharacterized protein n=1 Tax=Xylaria bambusicola TaxID=326684 RepID=UPI0020076483|nr:uncharacterized protein F5B22DRAFT_156678 [Xylaria bambusicola]KAI0526405.1 hypothetical protein F5B22DRAFT_156678 [Xylaria bambusicola]
MLPDIGTGHRGWARDVFRQSLRTSQLVSASSNNTSGRLDDPENQKWVQDLIRYILEGRVIAASYNIALLFILFLLTVSHVCRHVIDRRKRKNIERDITSTAGNAVPETAEDGENGADSSSSSTLEGSLLPQPIHLRLIHFKHDHVDVERQPLLGSRRRPQRSIFSFISSLLMYQPSPVLGRVLPSNGTSIVVAGYYGLNIFAHLYKLPFEAKHFFAFADRAGFVFIVNMPLLYLLAAKNQPLKRLTGHSYEALNIYHRRVGEWMCFEALVHFVGMVIWRLCLEPEWLATESIWHYFTHPLVLEGIGAFVSYELLYFTSLRSFRERWYELFLASHVVLQIAALVFVWFHFFTSRPYVLASLVIFVSDRIVWRIGMKSVTVTADVEVLEDGDTVRLSANWDISPEDLKRAPWRVFGQNISHGWLPADHVFISIPSLGGSNALQAHPFTIASAAPGLGGIATRAQLDLLIRAYSGFTSELLGHARLSSTVSVRIDGPYGSQDPLNALRASKTAVLIAGGSGIAVVFPLLWDLAITHPGRREIYLMWVIHSRSQRSWVSADRLDELRQAGVRIVIPRPTVEVGRPNIANYITGIARASVADIGVVVSGPDGLNRTVRNTCAREVRSGMNIDLRVEKFGW